MGVLQSTLLYLILVHSCKIVAYKDQEWKKATATYANDTEGSLITGTTSLSPWFFLRNLRMKTASCFLTMWLCYVLQKELVVMETSTGQVMGNTVLG